MNARGTRFTGPPGDERRSDVATQPPTRQTRQRAAREAASPTRQRMLDLAFKARVLAARGWNRRQIADALGVERQRVGALIRWDGTGPVDPRNSERKRRAIERHRAAYRAAEEGRV
jgi:hypothetical protein